jgi:hypothetical protein
MPIIYGDIDCGLSDFREMAASFVSAHLCCNKRGDNAPNLPTQLLPWQKWQNQNT